MTTISLDTETNGLDFFHGARPYFVTSCDEAGDVTWWEWSVDPLTRKVRVPPEDLDEVRDLLDRADRIVLQNAKFDATALVTVGVELPWDKVEDTLIAGHLLASNQPHNLTDMAIHYLGVDIEPHEKRLKEVVMRCRRKVQQARLREKRLVEKAVAAGDPSLVPGNWDGPESDSLARWRIAEAGLPEMPSAGSEPWKYDGWLPKAMVDYGFAPEEWEPDDGPNPADALRDYANADSPTTLALWRVMERELARRKLTKIYRARMEVLPIVPRMEGRGVTVSGVNLGRAEAEYATESQKAAAVCVRVAKTYGVDLALPKSGNSGALRGFVFGREGLDLTRYATDWRDVKRSDKTGEPSLDKSVLEYYEGLLPSTSRAAVFLKALKGKRKRDTALSYMEGYRTFWLPLIVDGKEVRGWHVLHPSLNMTGTDTLRWSSNNPNEQNISKQEGFNLRRAFGPAPGREWWSLDAQNIELRIPAYEAGERDMIALFERPDDPPYFGSNHLLNCHTVYPDVWAALEREVGVEKVGPEFKKRYKASHYQNGKNGGFAKQYGGQRAKVDATFRRAGAYDLLEHRFAGLAALNRKLIDHANKYGYVETMPDRTVDPERGYPLLCTRTDYGKVLPTVPLNYHVQGTACWWMMRAMVKVQRQLDEWREWDGFDGHLVMQVHDELVLDFPKRGDPTKENSPVGLTFKKSNLWRVRVVQKLMASCGDDIGVPTTVGVEYHSDNWGEGVTL